MTPREQVERDLDPEGFTDPQQLEAARAVTILAKLLLQTIYEHVPEGPDRGDAIRALKRAVWFAHGGVAAQGRTAAVTRGLIL